MNFGVPTGHVDGAEPFPVLTQPDSVAQIGAAECARIVVEAARRQIVRARVLVVYATVLAACVVLIGASFGWAMAPLALVFALLYTVLIYWLMMRRLRVAIRTVLTGGRSYPTYTFATRFSRDCADLTLWGAYYVRLPYSVITRFELGNDAAIARTSLGVFYVMPRAVLTDAAIAALSDAGVRIKV